MLDAVSPQVNISSISSRDNPAGLKDQQTAISGTEAQTTHRNQNTEISPEETSRPKNDTVQISAEAREIAKLETRDREVKAHEAAHAAVGGAYAGSPSLTYTKGPDGRSYATSGEVSIDVSPVQGDPLATLQKAEVVRAAALAPAQPSAQDMRVASRATAMAAQARADLANEVNEESRALSQVDEEQEPAVTNSEVENTRFKATG